jgi:hypothetical protein
MSETSIADRYPVYIPGVGLRDIQLVSKKSGNENFPNVNLVLSICQLIVYLTIPIK